MPQRSKTHILGTLGRVDRLVERIVLVSSDTVTILEVERWVDRQARGEADGRVVGQVPVRRVLSFSSTRSEMSSSARCKKRDRGKVKKED